LLRSLPRNPLPPIVPPHSSRGEMRIRPPRNHRNNPRHPNLGAFFNRPLHAIEFEDGKNQSKIGAGPQSHFISQRKFHALVREGHNLPAPNARRDCDVEFLSDLSAQNARQMQGMFASKSGSISMNLIGDPAAAGQKKVLSFRLRVFGRQFPEKSFHSEGSAVAVSFAES
jgi:hypothetical protein